MAIEQIYGPNQNAGFPVTGTGKSTPTNNGTKPYGQIVGLADPATGLPYSEAAGVPVLPEGVQYETVAASQTAQVLGATGAIGDYLAGLLIVPASTSPGNVIILDNAISITVFAGGASSVNSLVPIFVPLGIKSVSGAWKVTTGANVSVIGVGRFT